MPIYTKTGDLGETSLFGGKRVLKSAMQVDAYGSIDELNSWVGMIVSAMSPSERRTFLQKIQADLFILGGNIAGWNADIAPLATRVTEMEVEIDAMDASLPELTNFILPGGSSTAASVHITRSVCRRAERHIVALHQTQKIDPVIIQYLNRLSDLFFVLARFINKSTGVHDIIWSGIPRTTR